MSECKNCKEILDYCELTVAEALGDKQTMNQLDNQQEGVLQEAIRITSGDRQRDYDHPKPNHEKIAKMWNSYLEIRKDPQADISATDACVMMILLKIVRNAHTPKRDNWVDIPGYARCGARIEGFEP